MRQHFIESEDEGCLSDRSDLQRGYNFESTPKAAGSSKLGGLQNLDLKCKQLSDFIESLPLRLRGPVSIGSSHPDIEAPQLEESVTGERLLELADNTIRKYPV